jgi:hypothetical protein
MMTFFGLLSRRATAILAAMLVAGFAIRVVLAWKTYGQAYDMHSLEIIAHALQPGGIGTYDTVRWPYPGGFLPLLWAAKWATDHLGLRFDGIVQLPAILADLAIACLVTVALRWNGFDERRALTGAALVVFGPLFVIVSGYHGQIDSVAALPAFAGVLMWIRGGPRRALYAGLLIGLAASVKQPPGFVVLALLPLAGSWRERGILVAGTVAVPIISVLPWLVTDGHDVIRAMRQNSGVPGFGAISAFVQPDLTRSWSSMPRPIAATRATYDLVDVQRYVVAAGALTATALLWTRRVSPLHAASFVFLAIYVVNPNFGFTYLLWGVPFFLAAGYLLPVALLELLTLPLMAWLYWRPGLNPEGWSYLVLVQVVWLGLVFALVRATMVLVTGPLPQSGGRSLTRRAGTPA